MEKNHELFALPVSRTYWKLAAGELNKLEKVVLAALFIAMRVALSSVRIPVGDNLFIYFGFLVTSFSSMVCGPVLGVCAAFVSDILGFLLAGGSNVFFFGYTLSEMTGALIYALLLYRTRVSVVRLATAKLLVNGLVNVCMGALWSAIIYGKGYYYYLAKSVVKNATLLPIEILLMVLLFQAILPAARQLKLIPPQPKAHIPWF